MPCLNSHSINPLEKNLLHTNYPCTLPHTNYPMKFVDLDAQFQIAEAEIRAAINTVLDHKQFIMGAEVGILESELANFCGAKHVLSAASGTDALMMALMAHGVGPGDGIIAPSFTFVATAEVVQLLGATTVFVDVSETTFNIDCNALEQTIEAIKAENSINLKGIIPVDLFGLPADYDEILRIAKKHELFVVCDAAQSFGGEYKGIKVGHIGELSATSFFPAKPLGCYGDGGAVFTENSELADKIESIRFHGKGANQYDNIRIGITGRLDTIQAAVLSCKLKLFDAECQARIRIADNYASELGELVHVPVIPADRKSAYAVYTIRSTKRDVIKHALQQNAVPCAVYYPSPLHRQPAFQNAIGAGEPMPVADKLSAQVLSLPIHPYLTEAEQDKIIQVIKKSLRGI